MDNLIGLPDLSEFGEEFYWEISEEHHGMYSISIKKSAEFITDNYQRKKESWWKRTFLGSPEYIGPEKITTTKIVTVESSFIYQYYSLEELKGVTKIILQGILENPEVSYNSLEELYVWLGSDPVKVCSTLNKLIGMDSVSELGIELSVRHIASVDLSDELISLTANRVYSEFLKSQTEKLDLAVRESNNKKYVGKYPPKVLGE